MMTGKWGKSKKRQGLIDQFGKKMVEKAEFQTMLNDYGHNPTAKGVSPDEIYKKVLKRLYPMAKRKGAMLNK